MINIEELRSDANTAYFGHMPLEISGRDILEILDRLEAAEREVAHVKEVEFPRKVKAVADIWAGKCERLEKEREALRTALEKIADWDSAWGPYPETNEAWRAMVIVTAREAVPWRGEKK